MGALGVLGITLCGRVGMLYRKPKPSSGAVAPVKEEPITYDEDKSKFAIEFKAPAHKFHIVDPRPWPVMASYAALEFLRGLVSRLHKVEFFLWKLGLFQLITAGFLWCRDMVRESLLGFHSLRVEFGLRIGIKLFIVREIFFFLSFFWAYFHSALNPRVELGRWPPYGVEPPRPYEIPLSNTILLLARGAYITLAHEYILKGWKYCAILCLQITLFLGLTFTLLQIYEYKNCDFSISDSVYGRTFFLTTGFHGFHVIVGSIFIYIMIYRLIRGHFTPTRHFGFEARAWYWHFVDVVWLLLYIRMYWWVV